MPHVRDVIRDVRAYRSGEIPAKGKDPDTIKERASPLCNWPTRRRNGM